MISSMVFSAALIVLSSAKLSSSEFDIQGRRSFINILNKAGSSTDPWGTPESKIWKILCLLFILVFCFVLFKYE